MINDATNRLAKITQLLQEKELDACLLSTSVNILYATGAIFNGFLFIPRTGKPLRFVKRPVDLQGDDICFIRKPEQMPELLLERGYSLPKTLMLEGDEMSYGEWTRLQACFPASTFVNGTHELRKVRSIKTDTELNLLRASAAAHVRSYKKIPELYRPGMTDIELSIEIERIMRLEGNLGLFRTFGPMEAFMGSILTGSNASETSPYDFALGGAGHPTNPIGACGMPLSQGSSVMIDMSGNFTGYLSDLTRTFSIGTLPDVAYKAHQVSVDIVLRMQEMLKEGVVCELLWEESLRMANAAGLGYCYMGTTQQAKFVGHGVGLVINELPVLAPRMKDTLRTGMVLAIEPKFVLDGIGAVGVEDTFIVGETGGERITLLDFDIIDLTK